MIFISNFTTAIILFIFSLLAISYQSEIDKTNACKSNSCHPLTKCMPMKVKTDYGFGYEPVCMKVPTCSTKKCDPGQKCKMKRISCRLKPCFEVPTCHPDVSEASPEYQMPPAYSVKK